MDLRIFAVAMFDPGGDAALSLLGQTSIYKAIREGRLRIRKYGTRTIIKRSDLASFLENLPDER